MANRVSFQQRGSSFRRGVVRRESLWLFKTVTAVTMTVPGGTVALSLNAAALLLRPFTIVRTHMQIALRSDQSAAIETQVAAIGIAVVSDEAVAVGVTAVPTPVTEAGSDLWMLHQFIYADESQLTDRTRSGQFMSLDSKAMRKVIDGQDLVTVTEMSSVGGGVVMVIGGRTLIKLH